MVESHACSGLFPRHTIWRDVGLSDLVFQPHGSLPALRENGFHSTGECPPPFCVTQSDKSTELVDNGREGGELGQIKESKHPEEHLKL